jgi:hypothetical protein
MFIVALDIATHTGWTTSDGRSGVENLKPCEAKKGKPEKRDKKGNLVRVAVPAADAEPDEARWSKLEHLLESLAQPGALIVHEGPVQHHASFRAAQLAFGAQAIIAAWCLRNKLRRIEVSPLDLQRFVLGRKATPKEDEMLLATRSRLGYAGTDDDIADALWLLEWAKKHAEPANCGWDG